MTTNAKQDADGRFAIEPESEFARLPNIVRIAANLNDKITRLVGESCVPGLFKKATKETLDELSSLCDYVAELWHEVRNLRRGESISAFCCHCVEKYCLKCALRVKSLPFLARDDQDEIVAELEKIADVATEIDRSIQND